MRLGRLLASLLLVVGLVSLAPPARAAVPAGFSDTQVAPVPAPTALAFTPDGRLLVSSQLGKIRVIKNGAVLPTPALDLGSRICTNSERGVLGLAADPDPATRWVYVFHTPLGAQGTCPLSNGTPDTAASPRNRVSRFTLGSNDLIDPASELVLLDGIYSTGGFHNAGDLHVGKDGFLYVTTGDGGCDYAGGSGCGGANDASRDRNVLNGKVLRITTSGGVPAGNPFTGAGTASCRLKPAAAGTICQETFAWGLRNPFRFAFDPNATTTQFRVNDVGQNVWEEVNQGKAGADYGWNAREGRCQQTGSETCGSPTPAGMTDPVYAYAHSTTVDGRTCGSITGGAYVPNGAWPSTYAGTYLFGDYVCGAVFGLTPGNVRSTFLNGLGASSAVAMTFGPDAGRQSLYYTSYAGGGEVRKVAHTGSANRAPVARVSATPSSGPAPLDVTLDGSASSDPDGGTLSYRWSFGDGTPDQTTTTSRVTHRYTGTGTSTATLTVSDGALTSSATTVVRPGGSPPAVTITAPSTTTQFQVGATYQLSGTATDAQDGALPGSALSWTVLRHHAEHTHPYLGPVSGSTVALTAPAPEDLAAAANSYLEIRLTATDSSGATTTASRRFDPAKVPVTLATSPAGRRLSVNGTTVTGPTTLTSWRGYALQLGVPAQSDSAGIAYGFGSWSDGGAATHTYTTPAAASTVTATLRPSPSAPTSVTVRQSDATSATVTWSPPTSAGASTVTGYRVSRDGTDSAGAGPLATTVSAATRTLTLSRLVPGRTYELRVAAVNAAATGPAGGGPVTVVGPGQAWAPTSVVVRATTAGSANIRWVGPASDGGSPFTGFRVSRDGVDDRGEGPFSTVLPVSAYNFTMTRLVPGRVYHLSVQAVTARGHGLAATGEVIASSPTAVGAPEKVTARQRAAGSVTLTWEPPTVTGGQTVTGYRVTREGPGSPVTTTLPATARTHVLAGLTANQVYDVAVEAVTSGSSPTAELRIPVRVSP